RPETTFIEGKKFVEETIVLESSHILNKLQELYPKIHESDIVPTVHKQDIPKLREFLMKIDEQMKELNESNYKLLNDMKSVTNEMNSFSAAFESLFDIEKQYQYKPQQNGTRTDVREQFNEWQNFHHQQVFIYIYSLLSFNNFFFF